MRRGKRLKPNPWRNRILTIASVLVFVVGLAVLLYPTISNLWNERRQEQLIGEYTETVNATSAEDLSAEWEKAWAFNQALLPSILPDSFAIGEAKGESDSEYMSCLNLNGDGMMGYVEIPKIDVKLAIYHTTTDEVLQKGAGHLEGSSLPVGGENTHAVIAAHRGLPSAAMFTDLDKMELGDHFLIHVLDDTLCYEVDQILVVEPQDTDALLVEEGEDLVTLLTCTPYGVNSHRLLVRGHRVPYDPDYLEEDAPDSLLSRNNTWIWVIVGVAVVAGVVLAVYFIRKRNMRKKKPPTGSSGTAGGAPDSDVGPETGGDTGPGGSDGDAGQ